MGYLLVPPTAPEGVVDCCNEFPRMVYGTKSSPKYLLAPSWDRGDLFPFHGHSPNVEHCGIAKETQQFQAL